MTADDLFREAVRMGIHLSVTEDNLLRVDAPRGAVDEAMRAALRQHKRELIALCQSPERYHTIQAEETDPLWAEEFGWVLHVEPCDLPPTPFELYPGIRVSEGDRFLKRLQEDIRGGPKGPRALTGALQKDCRNLRKILDVG